MDIGVLILFLLGFYFLLKGSKILIEGATSVAKLFNISNWVIGIIIVGIGTSIPEFSINLSSLFNGHSTIGLGTIIGSNTFNILGILGIVALISPLQMNYPVRKDLLVNTFSILIVIILILFPVFGAPGEHGISIAEGWFLLGLFILWIFWMFFSHKSFEKEDDSRGIGLFLSVVLITAGIAGVFIGGRWVVAGAVELATFLGISDSLIALSVVAIGTSVPELAVSITAAIKREPGIAVGNIIGSNIFDFLGILGVIGSLKAIPFAGILRFDIFVTVLATFLLYIFIMNGRTRTLKRGEGFILFLLYIVYITFVFIRG